MPLKNDGLVNICFPVGTGVKLEKGETVKLNSDGTVSAVTAATDVVLGTVVVGTAGIQETQVTVQTVFRSVVRAFADGAVTAGAVVAATGTATVSAVKLPAFAAAVTTNYAAGIALKSGADDTEISVGLFYNPFRVTIAG